MILVGDEGEFGRCGGLCVLFGRGGFLRFKRRERAQGFFGNKAAVRDIEHINVQEHVQRRRGTGFEWTWGKCRRY